MEKEQKFSDQWIRLKELFKTNKSYFEIAEIMCKEGFRTPQGLQIDQKWVNREVHRARKEGFIEAKYKRHRSGGSSYNQLSKKYLSFEEITEVVLSAESLSAEQKIELLTIFRVNRLKA